MGKFSEIAAELDEEDCGDPFDDEPDYNAVPWHEQVRREQEEARKLK